MSEGWRDHAESHACGSCRDRISDYDLFVLDVLMPGRGGLEVCRRLRAEAALVEQSHLSAVHAAIDTLSLVEQIWGIP